MDRQFLWLTKGNEILKYKRNAKNGSIYKHSIVNKFVASNEDICRFVVKNDYIVSGGRNGSLALWNKSSAKKVFYKNKLHSNDVNSVDFCQPSSLLVSGSKDHTFKVWSLSHHNQKPSLELRNTIEVNDRVWNVSVNESMNSLIVGTAGCGILKPLLMYDIER